MGAYGGLHGDSQNPPYGGCQKQGRVYTCCTQIPPAHDPWSKMQSFSRAMPSGIHHMLPNLLRHLSLLILGVPAAAEAILETKCMGGCSGLLCADQENVCSLLPSCGCLVCPGRPAGSASQNQRLQPGRAVLVWSTIGPVGFGSRPDSDWPSVMVLGH